MRIVSVNELVEGDQLGRGLYTSEGRLLLKQGITLNHRLIEGIKRLGHSYIFVEMTAQQSSMAEYDTKKSLFYLTESILQQLFKSILTTSPFPIKPLLDWADHVTAIVADEPDLTISCQDLAPGGMELITHSLNVCFLSLLTAKALGYKNAQLIDVAIGSLLHDIGHVIPYDNTLLINHPIIGYDLLKKQRGIPDGALKIVLQHHEERLRRANQQIYDLTFLNVRSRIIKKLIFMMESYSKVDSNEYIIPVKITHQQIAEMVGAVRETVSKVLQELQDEGLIQIHDKIIHLKNLKILRSKLAEEV
jgi:hypothetical protein